MKLDLDAAIPQTLAPSKKKEKKHRHGKIVKMVNLILDWRNNQTTQRDNADEPDGFQYHNGQRDALDDVYNKLVTEFKITGEELSE